MGKKTKHVIGLCQTICELGPSEFLQAKPQPASPGVPLPQRGSVSVCYLGRHQLPVRWLRAQGPLREAVLTSVNAVEKPSALPEDPQTQSLRCRLSCSRIISPVSLCSL